MRKEDLPEELRPYQWVADKFQLIPGVEIGFVDMQQHGEEISLVLHNGRTGDKKKAYKLPLKTTFFVDYTIGGENCPHDYDINTIPDELRDPLLYLAMKKAERIFDSDGVLRLN